MPNNPQAAPGASLQVKVVPGAAQSSIAGWLGDRLKLRVYAAPEKGKANATVEALIARTPGLPRTAVRVVAGRTSPRNTLEVNAMAASIVDKKFRRVEK